MNYPLTLDMDFIINYNLEDLFHLVSVCSQPSVERALPCPGVSPNLSPRQGGEYAHSSHSSRANRPLLQTKTEAGKGAQSNVVKDTQGSWGVVSGTAGSAGKSSQWGIRTICGESGPLSREQGGSSVLCLPVSSLLRPKELGNYSDSTETAPVENHICSAAEGPLLTSFKAVFMPVAYGLVFLLGLTGNILVLAVLERHRHTRSSTETFLFHLAAADLLLVLILPFAVAEGSVGWVLGAVPCKAVIALHKVNFYCSSLLLACVAVDRYLAIVLAVHAYRHRRRLSVHATCAAVWLAGFFLCWSPYHVAIFLDTLSRLRAVGGSCALRGYLSVAITVGEFLGLAHCCLNPVLYRVLAKLGCAGPATLCQFLPAWRKSSLSESENATSLTTF
ncbi:PREDICTED: C-X-C chemokine receptor type 5 [Myotis davidii]|uniref:C-X-C chemokine receptor type 5 n=1 Tax=Myotis davidii TaxID=225400 RepID=UPI00076773B3|nr:PREDICTED: C-X-C chemokine receptor type 5 [Myotis davidii]